MSESNYDGLLEETDSSCELVCGCRLYRPYEDSGCPEAVALVFCAAHRALTTPARPTMEDHIDKGLRALGFERASSDAGGHWVRQIHEGQVIRVRTEPDERNRHLLQFSHGFNALGYTATTAKVYPEHVVEFVQAIITGRFISDNRAEQVQNVADSFGIYYNTAREGTPWLVPVGSRETVATLTEYGAVHVYPDSLFTEDPRYADSVAEYSVTMLDKQFAAWLADSQSANKPR